MRRLNVIRQLVFWNVVIIAGLSVYAYAQTRSAGSQPVADSIRASWQGAKRWVVESVDAMPEAEYSFKPVATVRTYGQILGHLAGANYVICSAAKGEKSPHAENAFESLATKAAIAKALNESVAYCDAAFASATDRTLGDQIEMPFGMGRNTRAAALLMNIGHTNEHYGNLVTYMRMKGVVPPSSR
jgi:uncharacterized damage-inducible protein DinB